MRRLFLLLALAPLALAAPARGEAPSVQALLNPDGSGQLFASPSALPPGAAWTWLSCRAERSRCQPFAVGDPVDTAGAAGGVVFKARAGRVQSAFSPPWNGNVAALKPPRVSGEVRANALVLPVRAIWSGGWAGDFDRTQLAECESPAGVGCRTLTDSRYASTCPGEGAVIDPAFTGRYLRVADRLYGPGAIFTMEAVTSPYYGLVWAPDAITSVSVVGQIAPAVGARVSSCGAPPIQAPSFSPPTHTPFPPLVPCGARRSCTAAARATISRAGLVTVRCSAPCSVVIVARRGRRTARLTARLGAGRTVVTLPSRALKRLRPGRATLTVYVDGIRIARRTVLILGAHRAR